MMYWKICPEPACKKWFRDRDQHNLDCRTYQHAMTHEDAFANKGTLWEAIEKQETISKLEEEIEAAAQQQRQLAARSSTEYRVQ